MYLLYLSEMNKMVLLGFGDDQAKLYINALNPDTAEENFKSLILKWLELVKLNLSAHKKREMDYSFMYTPFIEGCYCIKDLTLYIKKVREY